MSDGEVKLDSDGYVCLDADGRVLLCCPAPPYDCAAASTDYLQPFTDPADLDIVNCWSLGSGIISGNYYRANSAQTPATAYRGTPVSVANYVDTNRVEFRIQHEEMPAVGAIGGSTFRDVVYQRVDLENAPFNLEISIIRRWLEFSPAGTNYRAGVIIALPGPNVATGLLNPALTSGSLSDYLVEIEWRHTMVVGAYEFRIWWDGNLVTTTTRTGLTATAPTAITIDNVTVANSSDETTVPSDNGLKDFELIAF